jgi:hypothetical protein
VFGRPIGEVIPQCNEGALDRHAVDESRAHRPGDERHRLSRRQPEEFPERRDLFFRRGVRRQVRSECALRQRGQNLRLFAQKRRALPLAADLFVDRQRLRIFGVDEEELCATD